MSRNQLKMIAMIAMVIDHIGCRFIYMDLHPVLYHVMRGFGRLTFPIMCFFLVQGLYYTRSRWNYLIRLGAFAILSEVPFDFFLSGKAVDFSVQNVFFTLTISLAVIELMEFTVEKQEILVKRTGRYSPYVLEGICWGAMALGMVTAWWLHTDYSFFGVLMVTAFYLFREKEKAGRLFLIFVCICVGQGALEMAAVLALPMIYYYQPELKEGKTVLPNMFFYWFYPLHLLVLGVIRMYVSPF